MRDISGHVFLQPTSMTLRSSSGVVFLIKLIKAVNAECFPNIREEEEEEAIVMIAIATTSW